MISTRVWTVGEKVVHTGKPEWGAGLISQAIKTVHNGQPCQSLTIRFDRAGLKTITTAFASLIPASEAPSLPTGFAESSEQAPTLEGGSRLRSASDPLADALRDKMSGATDIREQMVKLPENATDPFTSPLARLKATLLLFKYTPTGASLLDWAAIQSGLKDPMSRFNRHELERFFADFVVVRDAHMKRTLQEARKADPGAVAQAIAQATPGVQQALRRLDNHR